MDKLLKESYEDIKELAENQIKLIKLVRYSGVRNRNKETIPKQY